MNIQIKQVNDATHFEAINERGHKVQVDGNTGEGDAQGMSPMELLLVSVATCSAVDVVLILEKQRQPLEDLEIDVNGVRPENTTPRPYKSINLEYKLKGDLDESKVARAVELAVEKYCSVADTIDRDVEISHGFTIN